jgi:hypothetical protein
MESKTKDISVTSQSTNLKNIALTDKEYLSYLQQQDLINAIIELTHSILRGKK